MKGKGRSKNLKKEGVGFLVKRGSGTELEEVAEGNTEENEGIMAVHMNYKRSRKAEHLMLVL